MKLTLPDHEGKILPMPLLENLQLLQAWLRSKARWLAPLGLIALAAYAFLLRSLRLNADYYYLCSPDSYFFNWVAQRVMAGQGPPPGSPGSNYTIHSGLAYPLAYIAKGVSYVFGTTPSQALEVASILLPLIIAVVTMILIYLGAKRLFNSRVALFSAITWAAMFWAVFFGAAGYTDRDGLSVLLLTIGALIFCFSRGQRFTLGGREVGWLLSGLGILVIEVLLYLEWVLIGPVLLLTILILYLMGKLLLEYVNTVNKEPNLSRRMTTVLRKVDWRGFVPIVALNAVIGGLYYHHIGTWFSLAWGTLSARLNSEQGPITASEMQGLSFVDLIGYQLFLITAVIGVYQAWKKRSDAGIFFACWFVGFAALSLISFRFATYGIPAACVLSGIGLNYLWERRSRTDARTWVKASVVVMLVMMFAFSWLQAAGINSQPGIAADKDWQDALTFVRESTPQDAVIMTQWGRGYWILDLGQREPFVDNGYYGYDAGKLRDVALVYSASDPAEAAAIMSQRGTGYVIFDRYDLKLGDGIMSWAYPDGNYTSFPASSLVVRSLNGDFVSGGGLGVVYKNDEIVILSLTESSQT